MPFDFAAAERELQRQHSGAVQELDAFFHREWLRSLFALAVDRLRVQCAASGRAVRFTIFNRYDLADEESVRPTYAALAGELKVSVADVTNDLAAARRDFRRLVMTVLREQCATDEEFENEARLGRHVISETALDRLLGLLTGPGIRDGARRRSGDF